MATHTPAISAGKSIRKNQKKLEENATQYRCQRQRTPPRQGPALLQGWAIRGSVAAGCRCSITSGAGLSLAPSFLRWAVTRDKEKGMRYDRSSWLTVESIGSTLQDDWWLSRRSLRARSANDLLGTKSRFHELSVAHY